MSGFLPEEQKFLDEAAARLHSSRRTFTDRHALEAAWQANCEDLTLEYDQPRFVKAQSRHGPYDPHYRLQTQTLANGRIFNDVLDGSWDGYNLDARLATLDTEDGGHHIIYPHDSRLRQNRQGRWEATVERNMPLEPTHQQELDALAPALLAAWHESGALPRSIQEILIALKQLGWIRAEMTNAMLVVRAWLLNTAHMLRVGRDLWLPAGHLPDQVTRTRLQVVPMRGDAQASTDLSSSAQGAPARSPGYPPASLEGADMVLGGEATHMRASWSTTLRTINLLEGFLAIPSTARAAYPLVSPGESTQTVLAAMWTEGGQHFWLWLDRQHHRFYGPGLTEHIGFKDPGDILRITWEPDIVTIRATGVNDDLVRREETRLIDVEALKDLRSYIGESYRHSMQQILTAAPAGLTWHEVADALSQRQQHTVHRGTVLALLSHGGFVHRDTRWFAAPDSQVSAHLLHAALVETPLVPEKREAGEAGQAQTSGKESRIRVHAVQQRLDEIYKML